MKNRKSIFSLLLAIVLLLGLFTPAMAGEAAAPAGKLVILHTNDIHGRAVADPSTGAMGYGAIAKRKADLEAQGANVLLLDAGDAVQGTPLVNLSYGAVAIDFMNLAGYDAMTLGNHEFDWGIDNFLQISEKAEFQVLCANVVDKISGESKFTPHAIFEAGDVKVGVFGLDTPEALTKTHPDKVQGINILMGQELYDCAQAEIDALKAEGADIIVCLGHLGQDNESEPNRSVDLIANTQGIDLFIDGHSHTLLPEGQKEGDTLLVSTGEYCQGIGEVTYENDAFTASIYTNYDPEVTAAVDTIKAEVDEQLSAVFATTDVDLNGERDPGVRTEETNLGDFAADAILWAAQQSQGEGVVAAITNGGGIRTSIPAGEISMNNMKEVFPFGNQVTVLTVTGAELLEALEAATCTTPEAIGAFPQVAGMEFTIDTSVAYEEGEQYPDSTYFAPAKPGSRVTIATVGGAAFDPEAMYTIATNDFTAAGGDTYYAFRYANTQTGYDTGVSLEDALVNYTTAVLGGVVGEQYAQAQGRITIK